MDRTAVVQRRPVLVPSAQLRYPPPRSAMSASRPIETSLKRLKCANTGHSPMTRPMGQIDPTQTKRAISLIVRFAQIVLKNPKLHSLQILAFAVAMLGISADCALKHREQSPGAKVVS